MKLAWIWPRTLNAQIKQAECQVALRQQRVGVRAATLARQIGHDLTTPTSLLLAGGVGFGLGELTRRSTPSCPETNGPPAGAETTPLQTALDMLLSARRLYVSLAPLVWIVASWQPAKTNGEEGG
jgi:hypothetical protein